MWNHVRPAFSMLVIWTTLTGIAYPLLVTGVAQTVFPDKANGSPILKDNKPAGSALIGQAFTDPRYFWGRPSATAPVPYNAGASGGSNLGPTNPALIDAVAERIKILREADPGNTSPIPVDLVTASGSGLDPHISPAAADYQASRVARARGLSAGQVRALVERYTESRQFKILGEPRVNVLRLNLALDEVRRPDGPALTNHR